MKKENSKKNVKTEKSILVENDNYKEKIILDNNELDKEERVNTIKFMIEHNEQLKQEIENHKIIEPEKQEDTERSMLENEMDLQQESEEWERIQAAKQSWMMEYNEEFETNTLMMNDDDDGYYEDDSYYDEDDDSYDLWNDIDTSIAVLFDESMDDYGGDADLFFDAHDDYFD